MSADFEDKLRSALRRVDPDDGFAQRVLSRVENEPVRSRGAGWRWLPAIAASVVISVVVVHAWQIQREREGLEARKQLIEALRMTGEKLDIAYRVVNNASQPADENPGA